MAGKFELFTDESGMHRFRLKASNGSIVVIGDAHEDKEALLKNIESLRKLAPYAEIREASASPA
ncbi:YegP family protein [Kitasatospora sp. LaBMicrA B282]|uniref:YegP family protein n=1 Tax=Kitasatospora sp. LaBMicrA B282 TaxID=3420949 RepID=UPI003D0F1D9D